MERRFIRYCAFQEAAKESLRLPKKTESGNVWSIWYAAKTGDTERIGVLLSRGVSVNAPDEDEGMTPLHWATKHGMPETVQWLVERGADINAADKNNNTPLHCCALSGNRDILLYLLSEGGKKNVVNEKGQTPFSIAEAVGNYTLATLLRDWCNGQEDTILEGLHVPDPREARRRKQVGLASADAIAVRSRAANARARAKELRAEIEAIFKDGMSDGEEKIGVEGSYILSSAPSDEAPPVSPTRKATRAGGSSDQVWSLPSEVIPAGVLPAGCFFSSLGLPSPEAVEAAVSKMPVKVGVRQRRASLSGIPLGLGDGLESEAGTSVGSTAASDNQRSLSQLKAAYRTLKLRIASCGELHTSLVICLRRLGEAYKSLGFYTAAQAVLYHAIMLVYSYLKVHNAFEEEKSDGGVPVQVPRLTALSSAAVEEPTDPGASYIEAAFGSKKLPIVHSIPHSEKFKSSIWVMKVLLAELRIDFGETRLWELEEYLQPEFPVEPPTQEPLKTWSSVTTNGSLDDSLDPARSVFDALPHLSVDSQPGQLRSLDDALASASMLLAEEESTLHVTQAEAPQIPLDVWRISVLPLTPPGTSEAKQRYVEAALGWGEATQLPTIDPKDKPKLVLLRFDRQVNGYFLEASSQCAMEAVWALSAGIEALRALAGDHYSRVYSGMSVLGSILLRLNRPMQAWPLLSQVLPAQRQECGDSSLQVARTLHILGRSLRACEKYDHAIRALQSAFKLYREILGPRHVVLATVLDDLGYANELAYASSVEAEVKTLDDHIQQIDKGIQDYRKALLRNRPPPPIPGLEEIHDIDAFSSTLSDELTSRTLSSSLVVEDGIDQNGAGFPLTAVRSKDERNVHREDSQSCMRKALQLRSELLGDYHSAVVLSRKNFGITVTNVLTVEESLVNAKKELLRAKQRALAEQASWKDYADELNRRAGLYGHSKG